MYIVLCNFHFPVYNFLYFSVLNSSVYVISATDAVCTKVQKVVIRI